MLRRTISRKYFQEGGIGKVHPDVMWGFMQGGYLGPGWVSYIKQLPVEVFYMQGGSTLTNMNDRVNVVQDPEDPRHPIGLVMFGHNPAYDGTLMQMSYGTYGSIDGGSRLMQILYEHYLEPFSMHRVGGILNEYAKVPNKVFYGMDSSIEYLGQTASLVGSVLVGTGSVVMEGVVIKGDTNCVYIGEGCQILENCCIVCDAPTDPLSYQRNEALNPYHPWDGMDGVCRVKMNSVIEPNCFLDSCTIGNFNRIGHNTKVLKGAETGSMVHILPGSVVLSGTKIGDGEIWGGAPAKKLGKVSKFEYKRPYYPSVLHRESICRQHRSQSRYGDQVVHFMDAMGKMNSLMIEFEHHVTPSVKAKMIDLVEGREPFHHKVTRLTQGWSPANRPEDKNFSMAPPLPGVKNFAEHNGDSADSKYHGSYFNITNFFNDFRW